MKNLCVKSIWANVCAKKILGEEFLGEKCMGEKSVQEETAARLGEVFFSNKVSLGGLGAEFP